MTRRGVRVHDAAAYLLHASAWRETSLIVQTFTRDHGLLALVAKGAKRPHSSLRAILSAFQPLAVAFSGAGEIKTLTKAETTGLRPLAGPALMSGWYMNELLLRLLPREDPHPRLYDAYDEALSRLSRAGPMAGELRRFEWILLREAGYGLAEELPDFEDPATERRLRPALRERLDELLVGRPLLTRKVLTDLRQFQVC